MRLGRNSDYAGFVLATLLGRVCVHSWALLGATKIRVRRTCPEAGALGGGRFRGRVTGSACGCSDVVFFKRSCRDVSVCPSRPGVEIELTERRRYAVDFESSRPEKADSTSTGWYRYPSNWDFIIASCVVSHGFSSEAARGRPESPIQVRVLSSMDPAWEVRVLLPVTALVTMGNKLC
jgi:hypothetical protein